MGNNKKKKSQKKPPQVVETAKESEIQKDVDQPEAKAAEKEKVSEDEPKVSSTS